MTGRLGILGASGFVGSALCERLFFEGHTDFVPFVHSTGNAWRITRLGLAVKQVDFLEPATLAESLAGCDVIVNCALGDDTTRVRGFDNLMAAVRKARPAKFIHLSSIAIYGQDPAEGSRTEQGRPAPSDAYGALKLRQDEQVFSLQRAGIASYVLCPGNITGPYSFFARGLVERLARPPLPLVDGGEYPSNLIHVDNLVEAILAAVRASGGAGERYFVNEERPVPWRELFTDLSARLGVPVEFVDVRRDEVMRFVVAPKVSLAATHLKVLASGEFRKTVSMLPSVGAINRGAVNAFKRMPQATQDRIRERLRWPMRVPKVDARPPLNDRYVTVQTRRYFHSPAKLRDTLGWRPPLSYERGLDTLTAWLKFAGIPDITS